MKRKLLTSYIVILLVGTLTTGGLSYSFIRNNSLRNTESALVNYASLIAESLQIEMLAEQPRNHFILAQKYSERTGVRVTLMDVDGRVLADSADNSIIFQSQADQPEYRHAIRHEVRGVQRFDENTNLETMFLALPPLHVHERSIIVRLSDPIEHILEESFVFLGYISISIVLGLILAMVVALANVRSIVKPVNELTMAAQSIAAGDLSIRIDVQTRDELEILAQTFNDMAVQLERTITTMQRQNVEMDSMLSGMTDGVLAVDRKGEILLVNRELRRLFPELSQNTVGRKVQNEFRHLPQIPSLVAETLEERTAVNRELAVGDDGCPVVRVKTSLMKNPEPDRNVMGVFLLVQDVTEFRKLENMRNNFVANVTHELRTPLTLIAGFVETLQGWDSLSGDDRRTALRVIDLETERLKRLINDLLTLSEIENIETQSYRRPVDAVREVRHVVSMMQPLAQEKQVSLNVMFGGDSARIFGNPDWFRQMLVNLVENGIKYTSAGGSVTVTTDTDHESLRITITDSGIGIPEDEQALVFDRFYRVRKVRGKETGGTGLGLTIVQDIVREFGGSIVLESTLGKGSVFVVTLPTTSS